MKKVEIDVVFRSGLAADELRELLSLVAGPGLELDIRAEEMLPDGELPDFDNVQPIGEILVKRGDISPQDLDRELKKRKPIGQ